MKRTTTAVALLALAVAAMAGCDDESPATRTPSGGTMVSASGMFVPAANAKPEARAFAYDTKLIPPGARSELTLRPGPESTTVALNVSGLTPNRAYGAHLHIKACGTDPKAAGGHFQHHPDPAATQAPSTNPGYANTTNEVWLDFTTDADGRAAINATVPWAMTPEHRPNALVIHAETTRTEAGKAGTAGARLACLTIIY